MIFKLFEALNNSDYNVQDDIDIVCDIFNINEEQLAYLTGINYENLIQNNLSKDDLDKLYNYMYSNKLYINDIKWQEYTDMYMNSATKILCHGSRSGIVGQLRLDVSGPDNDFGNGFYCGETLKQAGMFVADEPNASLYIVKANLGGLKCVKFHVNTEWMLAVAYYRNTLAQYTNHNKIKAIISKVDLADYILAPIADNRVYACIEAFVNGELTDKQTLYAMSATYLGKQYVFKTQKSLDNIELIDHLYMCPIEKAFFAKSNEIESNTSQYKAYLANKKYIDKGKYIDEILN